MSGTNSLFISGLKPLRALGLTGLLACALGLSACGKSDGGDNGGRPPVTNATETLLSSDQISEFVLRDSWCGKSATATTSISRRVTFNTDSSFGLFETTVCLGTGPCGATMTGNHQGSWHTMPGGYIVMQFGDQMANWNRYHVYQISGAGEPIKVRLKNDNGLTAFEFENCL